MTTTVITGANRGIGLELTRQCVARGDTVHALCRSASDELNSTGANVISGFEVTADESIDQLPSLLEGVDIDLLINNAGILSSETLDDLDVDAIRAQFEVNSLGPLRTTHALLPQLHPGSKVAIVTSRMGSVTDNTSGSRYGYRMSKAAVNIAGVSLARDLAPREVAVVLLHPGYVSTGMTNFSGQVDPADAAAGLLSRIEELDLGSTGSFRHMNGESLPW